jgi:hypothetical protein
MPWEPFLHDDAAHVVPFHQVVEGAGCCRQAGEEAPYRQVAVAGHLSLHHQAWADGHRVALRQAAMAHLDGAGELPCMWYRT